jgi:hypothetical protein
MPFQGITDLILIGGAGLSIKSCDSSPLSQNRHFCDLSDGICIPPFRSHTVKTGSASYGIGFGQYYFPNATEALLGWPSFIDGFLIKKVNSAFNKVGFDS